MKFSLRLLSGPLAAAILLFPLCSCVEKDKKKEAVTSPPTIEHPRHRTVIEPALLPNRFRHTSYMISKDKETASSFALADSEDSLKELQLKVGADITSKKPITLRQAMKAIVKNKNMSLSWASDVNQDLLVDVAVTTNDNFYDAIDNILRQLDYFHEMEGSTMVIKYRETKQYHVAMPFIKQEYKSETGSNEGSITSSGNTFDVWENIQKNIDSIIATWGSKITTPEAAPVIKKTDNKEEKQDNAEESVASAPLSRRISSTESTYTIDKPVGLITVHAPKSLQERIANYLSSLEKQLYKQIIIEAKIIEVQLSDNSSLGVNWNLLLNGLSWDGIRYGKTKSYGREDNIENESENTNEREDENENKDEIKDETESNVSSIIESNTRTITDTLSIGTTAATFISSGGAMSEAISTGMTLAGFNFTSFIKALQDQGQTSILSNPKISVLNGQPALISVGRDVTYIKDVTTTTDEGGGISTSVTTDQILSGVGLSLSAVVKGNDEIVMNLVPITSELSQPIQYESIGFGNKVGLPEVNKREMSTTVKIKNGSMLVVGGLISETDSKSGEFLPGVKDMPYLKYLFGYEEKKKSKRELIILLRPRIIN